MISKIVPVFFLFYFFKVMQEYKQISYDTIMVDLFFSTKIIF